MQHSGILHITWVLQVMSMLFFAQITFRQMLFVSPCIRHQQNHQHTKQSWEYFTETNDCLYNILIVVGHIIMLTASTVTYHIPLQAIKCQIHVNIRTYTCMYTIVTYICLQVHVHCTLAVSVTTLCIIEYDGFIL